MRGAAEVREVEAEGIRGDVGVVEEMLVGEAVGVVKIEEGVQVETSAEAA